MTGIIQKIYDVLLILIFLTIILVPLISGIVEGEKKWSEGEKRVLEVFPSSPENFRRSFPFLANLRSTTMITSVFGN